MEQIKKSSKGDYKFVIWPQLRFIEYSVETAQGVLSKKCTSDNQRLRLEQRHLESVPGTTPRVLSMRLKELENQ